MMPTSPSAKSTQSIAMRRDQTKNLHARRSNPSRRKRRNGLLRFARNDDYYLIAQVTATEIDSVSSPCAIGVGVAAMPATILLRNIGCGGPPSEIPRGTPSVTPAALA